MSFLFPPSHGRRKIWLLVPGCVLAVALVGLGTQDAAGAELAGAAAPVRWVGRERQLFVDTHFLAETQGTRLQLHPPRKSGEKLLVYDQPWESATLNWFSVLQDKGVIDRQARFRMWYECYDVAGWPTADDTSFCYAESRDGVHWTKPALGMWEYQGSRQNNILFRQIGRGDHRSRVHGSGVFMDPQAPPEARYKVVSQGLWKNKTPPYRIAGMVSPDGLHWTRLPEPICDVFADSQYSCFWDPQVREYVLFGRTAGNIGRAQSPNFAQFPPLSLVLQSDARDPSPSNLYNAAAVRYPGAPLYLMFPSLYQRDPKIDTLDIRLAVSRDSVHWTYPEQGKAFIPLGPPGAWDSGSLYIGQGMIEVGEEYWFYYSGSPLRHQESELENLVSCPQPRAFSRAVLRRDRFAAVTADRPGGWFVTPLLRTAGEKLHLNLHVRPGGRVRVAVLDANGQALSRRGWEDAVPMRGDHLDALVRWKNGWSIHQGAGQAVRLKVELVDASVFAFQFR